jgi:hypothetical protein
LSPFIFILRSLRCHGRLHVASAAGVAVATAVLAGALMLGDSVRYSLERRQLLRLGRIGSVLASEDRFFRAALADDIAADAAVDTAALLTVPGVVTAAAAGRRINRANVVGVDARFLAMAERPEAGGLAPMPGEALINGQAARRLGVVVGDELVVRIGRHGWLPLESPFVAAEAAARSLRVRVKAILAAEALGDFDLRTSQSVPANVFVQREELATALGLAGQANVACCAGESEIRNPKFQTQNPVSSWHGRPGHVWRPTSSVAGDTGGDPSSSSGLRRDLAARATLMAALQRHWQLADAGLDLAELPDAAGCELRSARIFLTPAEEAAARAAHPAASGVLGYLVNEIRAGERSTPYSFVAGMAGGSVVPMDLAEDEIVVNQWLADDLRVGPGGRVTLRYFVVGDRRELREAAAEFRVRAVVPLAETAADPTLAPAFPGLTDAGNCRDWDAGLSVDIGKIRDQDEAYWQAHGATPKAFVGLDAARRMWANRYGGLTAVRYPAGTDLAGMTAGIRERLTPESFGLRLAPVRAEALQAARSGVNFGQLFLGLSMFLLASAWLLAALLFGFGIENRASEVGLLRALGFSRRETGILLLVEGMVPALLGAVVGGAGGVFYNMLLINGLSGAWQGAAGGAEMIARFSAGTVAAGVGLGFAAAVIGMAWMLFRQLREDSRGGARSRLGLGLRGNPCECGSQRLLAKSLRGGARSHLGLGLRGNPCESGSQRLLAKSLRGGARSHLGLGLRGNPCESGSQRLLAKSSRGGARSHLGLGLRGNPCESGSQRLLAKSSRGGARSHLGLGLRGNPCESGSQRLLAKSSRGGARSHLGLGLRGNPCESGSQRLLAKSSRGGARSHLGLGLRGNPCESGSQRLLAKSLRGGVPLRVMNALSRGFGHRDRWPTVVALLLLGVALAVALVVSPERGREVAGAFFLVGTLALVAMLMLAWSVLVRIGGRGRSGVAAPTLPEIGVAGQGFAPRVNFGTPSVCLADWRDDADPTVGVPRGACRTEDTPAAITPAQLPVRNAARRPGRSLTVLALTAAGIFLVVAVAANRRNPGCGGERRSGTGGFALYGETAMPWFEDLNGERARGRLGLDATEGASFVQIKVRDGDDASCLNLNRVAQPRLLGVDPEDFRRRGAFSFAALAPDVDPADPWSALTQPWPDGVVPAVADQSVIQWGLGKRLGDELSYVDEHGRELRLRLVGALADSVFQGNVLVAQSTFSRHFPSNHGFRAVLVDLSPGEDVANFASGLSRALRDLGPELTSTPDRLSAFQSVENTYLSAFLWLGGLGVLLGAAGVGMVLMRNALERRGELALLRAVGFSRAERFHLLLAEHAGLLVAGVVLGLLAGLLAVLPAVRTASERIPWRLLVVLAAGIVLHGLAWTAIAAARATRGTSPEGP